MGVNMRYHDDKANVTFVTEKYAEMAADSSIDFIFGPVNSDFAIAARTQTERAQRLFIGTASASSSVYLGTSFTFNAVGSARTFGDSIIPLMRLKGARSISVIYDSVSPFAFDACLGHEAQFREQGIDLLSTMPLVNTQTSITDEMKCAQFGLIQPS